MLSNNYSILNCSILFYMNVGFMLQYYRCIMHIIIHYTLFSDLSWHLVIQWNVCCFQYLPKELIPIYEEKVLCLADVILPNQNEAEYVCHHLCWICVYCHWTFRIYTLLLQTIHIIIFVHYKLMFTLWSFFSLRPNLLSADKVTIPTTVTFARKLT